MPKFLVTVAHGKQGQGKCTRQYQIDANSQSSAENEALSKCRKECPNDTIFELRSAKEIR